MEKEDTLAVVVVLGEVEIRPVMVGCSGEPSSSLNIHRISRDLVTRDEIPEIFVFPVNISQTHIE